MILGCEGLQRRIQDLDAQVQQLSAANSLKQAELRRLQSQETTLGSLREESTNLHTILAQKDDQILRLQQELDQRSVEIERIRTDAVYSCVLLSVTYQESRNGPARNRDDVISDIKNQRDELRKVVFVRCR